MPNSRRVPAAMTPTYLMSAVSSEPGPGTFSGLNSWSSKTLARDITSGPPGSSGMRIRTMTWCGGASSIAVQLGYSGVRSGGTSSV